MTLASLQTVRWLRSRLQPVPIVFTTTVCVAVDNPVNAQKHLHLHCIYTCWVLRRAACTRLHDGAEVAPEEELVIWVPARLLLCGSRDADLAQHLTETLLRAGLFPAKVPLATAARQWAAIYMSSTAQVRRPVLMPFSTSCIASDVVGLKRVSGDGVQMIISVKTAGLLEMH